MVVTPRSNQTDGPRRRQECLGITLHRTVSYGGNLATQQSVGGQKLLEVSIVTSFGATFRWAKIFTSTTTIRPTQTDLAMGSLLNPEPVL